MTEAEVMAKPCWCGGEMKETAAVAVRHSDTGCQFWFKSTATAYSRPRCRDCPHAPRDERRP